MPPDKFRVALIQMSCGPEPEQNLEKAITRIADAVGRGAQVVCLPELFQTQYFCQREDTALFDLADERHVLDAVAGDLRELRAMLHESGDLVRLIRSPVVSRDEQGKAVRRAPSGYHWSQQTRVPRRPALVSSARNPRSPGVK